MEVIKTGWVSSAIMNGPTPLSGGTDPRKHSVRLSQKLLKEEPPAQVGGEAHLPLTGRYGSRI